MSEKSEQHSSVEDWRAAASAGKGPKSSLAKKLKGLLVIGVAVLVLALFGRNVLGSYLCDLLPMCGSALGPDEARQTVDAQPRSFKCKTQPLPEFTLGATSNPSDAEVAQLCACVWSRLPEGGWERETAGKIAKGEDPGWRGRAFISRFGDAMDACGAGRL